MSARKILTAFVAAALLLAGPRIAGAGEPEAEAFFRAAKAAYARKEYRPAATAFEAAFREAPHPAAMYNAAIAWELAGEPDRAADAHHTSLKLSDRLTREQIKDARARLSRLEKRVATIDVEAPADARISLGRLARVEPPARFHVLPGDHAVTVTFADGGRASKQVRAVAAQKERIAFTAPSAASDSPTLQGSNPPGTPKDRAPGAGTIAPEPDAAPDAAPADAAGSSSALLVGGWVGTVTGVALSGAAVGLGIAAVNARDDFDASVYTDVDARNRADLLRTWTNVAWVGAAVAGTVGIVLFIASGVTAAPTKAQLRITPGGAVLRGQF